MSATFSADIHANGTLNSVKVRYLLQKTTHFSEISALENVPNIYTRVQHLHIEPSINMSQEGSEDVPNFPGNYVFYLVLTWD